ncbi:MAG: hypothetical protein HRT47_11170 [Candidatus Caenarcaniphilales bacterium]|nr:hypothetical protein [Candidatus Caenarcaniphilales bacterium]
MNIEFNPTIRTVDSFEPTELNSFEDVEIASTKGIEENKTITPPSFDENKLYQIPQSQNLAGELRSTETLGKVDETWGQNSQLIASAENKGSNKGPRNFGFHDVWQRAMQYNPLGGNSNENEEVVANNSTQKAEEEINSVNMPLKDILGDLNPAYIDTKEEREAVIDKIIEDPSGAFKEKFKSYSSGHIANKEFSPFVAKLIGDYVTLDEAEPSDQKLNQIVSTIDGITFESEEKNNTYQNVKAYIADKVIDQIQASYSEYANPIFDGYNQFDADYRNTLAPLST